MRHAILITAAAALAGVASAQQLVVDRTAIPQGAPNNASSSENVDFGDVDGDGDWDAVFADGGDSGPDQNRIWINQGGLQGGTLGIFVDETALRLPVINDTSRDIEFADIDADGDLDLHVTNASTFLNEPCRFWINSGGVQGGTPGFYVDETATRWVNLGINNGSTILSSLPPGQVLPGGGFVDWSGDTDFGDLDGDGDLDLVHSTYGMLYSGSAPTRLFLNDGSGNFEEFNPSGVQLAGGFIPNGTPGLWCEGQQSSNTTNTTGAQCDIAESTVDLDIGDVDRDFDLDILLGSRQALPRLFQNRLAENGGAPGFRDVTHAAFPPGYSTGSGHYEQELGDLDGDRDLDVYGLNWRTVFMDVTLENNGAGVFFDPRTVPLSGADEEEADFFDYDNDGDLDVFVANFSGADRLYRNDTAGTGIVLVDDTGNVQSNTGISRDADCCDVDEDGDYDVFTAASGMGANVYYRNTTLASDLTPPGVDPLEQAPDRTPGVAATVVRAEVYDNAPYYVTWYELVELRWQVNGGPPQSAPMRSVGGQVFRGEIPGAVVGSVAYWVFASDRYGNATTSVTLAYSACADTLTYCTGKPNSLGCTPTISGVGSPSVSQSSGFVVAASNVLNSKAGLLLYGLFGRAALPFQAGTLCLQPPLRRTVGVHSGGTPPPALDCTGIYSLDINAFRAGLLGGNPAPELFVPGTVVNAQWWGRDPGQPVPNNTTLSNALEFTMCL